MNIDVIEIMRGKKGVGPALLRAAMACVEPFYASAGAVRNLRYDLTGGSRLGRPVICVGNITTGGTGKTPVVRWLAESLRDRGLHLAILLRGYGAKVLEGSAPSEPVGTQPDPPKKSAASHSDEQLMLDRQLNVGGAARITIKADPDRVRAGRQLLESDHSTSAFLLDDGFQHRRLARDFDLVLIDASNPFGFGHVLPRGLLREPLGGLRRADAFLITRASQATTDELRVITEKLTRYNPTAPICRADHRIEGIPTVKFFAFAGIGNPQSFQSQLAGPKLVGCRWFPDHHAYTTSDIDNLRAEASRVGASQLVTTEKDWVKIAQLPNVDSGPLTIMPLQLQIRFHDQDEQRLLDQILKVLPAPDGSSAGSLAGYSPGKSTPPTTESGRRQ